MSLRTKPIDTQVLRKELHDGVDDGWWEGEINGKVGVFPSLVVQEESAEGNGVVADEDDDEEDGILVEVSWGFVVKILNHNFMHMNEL